MNKFSFNEIAINSTEKKKPEPADKDTYLGLEHLDSGSLKVKRFGADVAPIGDKLVMKKGDVLFGKRRAYQKKVAIAPFDGIFSAHGMVLRPREEVVDKDFFPLFISSDYFLDAAIKISVGSLSPTINWNDLKVLEFSLPELSEQKKIARVIWAALDLKEAYQKMLAACDEIARSRFIEMFGTENSPKNNVRFMPLGKIASYINGFAFKPEDWGKEGLPIIRIQNLTGTSTEYNYFSGIYPQQVEVQDGDVLISWSASLGIYLWNSGKAILNQHIFKVAFDKMPVNKKYFIYAVSQKLNDLIQQTHGSTMKHIVKKKFDETTIAYPSEELQQTFAAFIEQLDKSKFSVAFFACDPVFPVFCRGPPEKSVCLQKITGRFYLQSESAMLFLQKNLNSHCFMREYRLYFVGVMFF